jgi:asparagine synthetase A
MELFKYCKAEHADSMLTYGSARIGTLYDWRHSGKYGEWVSDTSEGHTVLTGNLIFYDPTHIHSMSFDSWIDDEELI